MWYSPVKCGYGWVWRGGSDLFFPSAGTEGVIPTPLPRITLACWEKIANAWHKEICSLLLHSSADICIFESESDVTYDQVWWPILGICALHFTHPKCTHTVVNTHPEQWAAIYAAAPGEQLGVRCLAQVHLSRGIEGGESTVHSLPPPTIPAGPRLELAIFQLRVRLSNH